MDGRDLQELEDRLGIRFRKTSLLVLALTHRSAASAHPTESYERLEFLGDAVIGLVITERLYRLHRTYNEGDLAKAKAYVVSEDALAEAARSLGLDAWITLGPGDATARGQMPRSILADAFESVVGAVYLDRGLRAAKRLVHAQLDTALRTATVEHGRMDAKSALQVRLQARERRAPPQYRVVGETGAEHDKTFVVQALLDGAVLGQGAGKSKKRAEQAAAQDALRRMGNRPERGPEVQ